MSLWCLLLISLSGALAQINLDKKVFVFPKRSTANYVLLRPTLEQRLQRFTLCLRYFTDLTEPFAVFSAASRQRDNEILLQKQSPVEYYVWVAGDHFVYRVPRSEGTSPYWKRKEPQKKNKCSTELSIILGQDQDSFGGALDAQQAFVREMAEVYLWDRVLSPELLQRLRQESVPPSLVNWTALNFELRGNMAIELEIHLQQRAFVFPEASNANYVIVDEKPKEPLTNFTLTLRYYTDLTHSFALFSYATKESPEAILLSKPNPEKYHLSVGSKSVTFAAPRTQDPTPRWEQIHVNWDSVTGLVEFWVDGNPLPRKGLQRGYSISSEASIVLGQAQRTLSKDFDARQSFVGELTDVFLWNAVLTPNNLADDWNDHVVCNLVVNWRALRYDIQGYVVAQRILGNANRFVPSVTPTRRPFTTRCPM
ncbi:hypothetical protein lerEdw1_003052 [Lerista edwardsae]|nr:hypothetical protein lerEdw1_003052 [Lerista edwardsae]